MAEQPAAETAATASKRRRHLLAGVLAAVALMACGGWLTHKFLTPQPAPASTEAAEVALLDLRQVMAAHPRYAELSQLREERQALELELEDLQAEQPPELTVEAPEVEAQPFNDAVWQKNAQTVIGGRAELAREQKALRESYRQEHEAEYTARRDALDAEYRNAILNLQLKLDNSEAMRLSAQDVAELEQQLTALKQERGQRQWQMYQAWQQEITAYVQSVMGPKFAAWQQSAEQARARQQSEELAKQSTAQARDTAAMDQQMDASRLLQDQLVKRQALQAKQDECNALEAHILNDIAGRAAKLAIMYHYTLMLVTPVRPVSSYLPTVIPTVDNQEHYEDVIGVNTTDVTEEMIAEMQSL